MRFEQKKIGQNSVNLLEEVIKKFVSTLHARVLGEIRRDRNFRECASLEEIS